MSMGLFKPNIEKLQAKKKIRKLIKAGKHYDPVIRKKSLRALGETGDPRALEPLIRALSNNDFGIVSIAVEALAKLGDPRAVEPLLRILTQFESRYCYGYESGRRKHVAMALSVFSQKGDKRAVEFFIQALKDEKYLGIRQTARDALGRIEDKRAVGPLIRALTDENAEVRRAAATALNRLAWKSEDVLERAYHLLARDDSQLLRERGESVVPGFLHILASDSHRDIRNEAARALGTVGDKRAVEPLIQVLRNKDVANRQAAAEALGRIGDTRAVGPLIQSLTDENAAVVSAAAKALGEIGDERAVEPLIRIYGNRDVKIRPPVAGALGRIGDKRAAGPLAQALTDTVDIPWGAAEALGKIGDKRYAGALIDYLFSNLSVATPEDQFFKKKAVPYKNMFHDFAELIIRVTSYEMSFYRQGETARCFNYSNKEAEGAVTELSKIESPICSNILHKIAGMKDLKVLAYEEQMEDYSHTRRYDTLSFEVLRGKAREELKRRGNISFEPSAFLVEDGWKI